ncbi:porin family protein [Microbulbifer sp. SA54]|uniref:porin family protein n=1 Tax=Microbulbifer sp. SA54 TaxID=3401577 RepID=UPI003AAFCFA8
MLKEVVSVTAVLAVLSGAVNAQAEGFYVKGGVGSVDFDTELVDNSFGFELGGGYQLNNHLGFEASYWNSGSADIEFYDFADDRVWGDAEVSALTIGAVLSTDMAQPLFGGARIGLSAWEQTGSLTDGYSGYYEDLDYDADGTDAYYGLFAGYNLSPNVAVVFDYTKFSGDDVDPSTFGGGVRIKF